jgi:hypothetical protein
MDPFEPIRVDLPEPDRPQGRPPQPAGPEPGVPHARRDPADASFGIAHTLLVLNAIDQRTDAAVSGAAEVAGSPGPVDDPFDAPAGDGAPAAADGDGCAAGALALLLALTAAAGTAAAFIR